MKLRILVFDDSDLMRDMLKRALEERGHEVLPFSDPHECSLLRKHECRCGPNQVCADAILSDRDMPGMPGLTFFAGQVAGGCHVPNIAMMSGSWNETDLRAARRMGCRIFQKPVDIAELYDWLDECAKKTPPYRKLLDWFVDHPAECAYRTN
jgi:CheY-like chemotaxis protein